MNDGVEKLTRYDPKNLTFRKAYIRERLADIKREREAFGLERDQVDAALTEETTAPDVPAVPVPSYSNDNPRFRKGYIRERLQRLKEEREALVAEREEMRGN